MLGWRQVRNQHHSLVILDTFSLFDLAITGFILPPAGGDVQWLQDNWEAFNQRANEGDEEMAEMVREVQERGLMDGTNGLKVSCALSSSLRFIC